MVRSGEDYDFICVLCEYHTFNKGHMERHIRKHIGDKPYKCTYCEYESSRNDSLKRHVRIRHDKPV